MVRTSHLDTGEQLSLPVRDATDVQLFDDDRRGRTAGSQDRTSYEFSCLITDRDPVRSNEVPRQSIRTSATGMRADDLDHKELRQPCDRGSGAPRAPASGRDLSPLARASSASPNRSARDY